jgi:hypothetical protein
MSADAPWHMPFPSSHDCDQTVFGGTCRSPAGGFNFEKVITLCDIARHQIAISINAARCIYQEK